MKDLMWAYLMHLGTNMWGQEGEEGALAEYRDHLATEDDVWRETIDFLPACGFNTVLIDVGDGIVYESHPEINSAGAWSKDKLKKELDRMRAMGHGFPEFFGVITAETLDVRSGYDRGRVVADHAVPVAGTCPLWQEPALQPGVHETFLHLDFLVGIDKV